jgi:hypothetical protein
MVEGGIRVAAVYEGEKYLGLISQEDINEAVLIATFMKEQERRRLAQSQTG